MIEVTTAAAADERVLIAVERLLGQLSASAVFDPALVERVVREESCTLLLAEEEGEVLGMATLVVAPSPSGLRGHVEDVVVDEAARGRGAGRALVARLVELAREARLRSLELTSRPSRVAAIALYESAGFRRRETNVLRIDLV
ncbi:GNAT family N-acetyltransferase [Amnibacterium kyonggiense]|uniref:Acetyltransferase (GNAT) family protein n=1 Tax=Amnibacterium kyonggiense TaxID=595671 RepID=A0A4V3EB16_9MICO|nr:GNAT family N-acetyltransferase [Amnibacterium kyonggiense]TDS79974.1 acetyltransferase (GNAT) family protein [Amnibacterium kyonggiense]